LSAAATTTTTNPPLRRLTSAFPPFLTTALLPLLLQNPAVKGLAFAFVDVPSYNVPLVTWHDNANVNAATAANQAISPSPIGRNRDHPASPSLTPAVFDRHAAAAAAAVTLPSTS